MARKRKPGKVYAVLWGSPECQFSGDANLLANLMQLRRNIGGRPVIDKAILRLARKLGYKFIADLVSG